MAKISWQYFGLFGKIITARVEVPTAFEKPPIQGEPDRSRGFSLLEMLLALVVIAVLSAIGLGLRPAKKSDVASLTEQWAQVIQDGRQKAMLTGKALTLQPSGEQPESLALSLEFRTTQDSYVTDPGTGFAIPASTEITLPTGGYDMAREGARFQKGAVPGVGLSQLDQVQPSLAGLKALEFGGVLDDLLQSEHSIFACHRTMPLQFAPGGQINQSVFMTVSHPKAHDGSPLGLILVTPQGGVQAFYHGGEDSPKWRRL